MARRTFPPSVKRHAVSLVRQFGITGALERLNAHGKSSLSNDRNKTIVPVALNISAPTLGKYAKECGVVLSLGRRPATV
jgi:hypothetical protein